MPPAITSVRPAPPTYGWHTLALVLAGAVSAFVLVELALHLVLRPPTPRTEVNDALARLRREAPSVLVIGSSHARTFDSVGAHVAQATDGMVTTLPVPLEAGKLTGYWWVLKHRVAPLLDESAPMGDRRREALRQAVVVTSWWDSCQSKAPDLNIPGRAWTFADLAADVARNGITSYNRAYLSARWSDLLVASSLVRNRAHSWLVGTIRERYFTEAQRAPHDAVQTADWQDMVEKGRDCIADPIQMAALDSVVDFFRLRNVPVTILLYPLKPGTLTDRARRTTLPAFASIMRDYAAERAIPLIDATTDSPLTDTDFSPDYDHLRASGDSRFAAWAVAGPFAFLARLPSAGHAGEPTP